MNENNRTTTAPQPKSNGRENPTPVHTLDKGNSKRGS